jgi:uncharacterized membrane protein
MEIKYIDTFWEQLLPITSRTSRTPNSDWTRVIRDHYTSDGPFRNAMLALTLSRIGQRSGNNSVARSGAIHYNDCLREVARRINLQKGACNDEVLTVCLILSIYEIMCSPSSQGSNWQSHLRGVGTLIQLRGPHGFAYGYSHKLFVSARMDVVSLPIQNLPRHSLKTCRYSLRLCLVEQRSSNHTTGERYLGVRAALPSQSTTTSSISAPKYHAFWKCLIRCT